eukprot:TRINITY_DN9411_c4_g1_i1.p1 TRINITY_DN9411_c4_g1~~TRINITY_DN9411_c4_g1_i1.p1  ORF type:complete len:725 (+),score=213.67 TRINITY_DN9411_c4_g1_i1:121-2175(+)
MAPRGIAMAALSTMTVAQLREECRCQGLKVGGVKQELVERLKNHTKAVAKKAASEAKCAPPSRRGPVGKEDKKAGTKKLATTTKSGSAAAAAAAVPSTVRSATTKKDTQHLPVAPLPPAAAQAVEAAPVERHRDSTAPTDAKTSQITGSVESVPDSAETSIIEPEAAVEDASGAASTGDASTTAAEDSVEAGGAEKLESTSVAEAALLPDKSVLVTPVMEKLAPEPSQAPQAPDTASELSEMKEEASTPELLDLPTGTPAAAESSAAAAADVEMSQPTEGASVCSAASSTAPDMQMQHSSVAGAVEHDQNDVAIAAAVQSDSKICPSDRLDGSSRSPKRARLLQTDSKVEEDMEGVMPAMSPALLLASVPTPARGNRGQSASPAAATATREFTAATEPPPLSKVESTPAVNRSLFAAMDAVSDEKTCGDKASSAAGSTHVVVDEKRERLHDDLDRAEQALLGTSSASPVQQLPPVTTSPLAAKMYMRLKEKEEARARGEKLPAASKSPPRWQPRASPLQQQLLQKSVQALPVQASLDAAAAVGSASPLARASPLKQQQQLLQKNTAVPVRAQASVAAAVGSASPLATRVPASPSVARSADVESIAETRRRMLAKLTSQMQLMIEKLQDKSLDERSKEKYKTLISSVQKQIESVSQIRTNLAAGSSPAAAARYGASPFQSPRPTR